MMRQLEWVSFAGTQSPNPIYHSDDKLKQRVGTEVGVDFVYINTSM